MRIAVLDDYVDVSQELADWSSLEGRAEITVFREPFGSQDAAAKKLADFEIVVGMRERTPFPAALLRRLPKLKLLITTGQRNSSFDIEAARAQGVTVCCTGSTGNATAELAIGLMIALMRDIPGQFASMRQGGWQTRLGRDLSGKTLGLLGLGKVGSVVAAAANAFRIDVIAWSQNLTDEKAMEHRVRRVEKDELFRRSDVLSVHVLLSDRTTGLVGARELGLMKPTAYLINTARWRIIDGEALLRVLQEKKIAGAAIDVYDTEPLPTDAAIRRLDNVLLTPHIGYVTERNFTRMYQDAIEDIVAFLDGKPIRVITGS
ncbi:MAG: D-2-hydroxyacid dehydrogenase family protein [Syntrophales bacterium]|jgi:D-3-phosphoglycerate dehydrogenase|nr:D-2-hydroxyacid dehydrogenase family protein [Syntrophales bacterium]